MEPPPSPVSGLAGHRLAVLADLASTQALSVFFDGIARLTAAGYSFLARVAEADFRPAVRERDEPFGDFEAVGSRSGSCRPPAMTDLGLEVIRWELQRRRHLPFPDQGGWLGSVLRGHFGDEKRRRRMTAEINRQAPVLPVLPVLGPGP